jgi:hypothetical protein
VRIDEPLAVPIDGLLTWLGVIAPAEGDADPALEQAFGKLLSVELLGLGKQFSLSDFRVLAELDMECAEMPATDVENCITYLRDATARIPLDTPAGRERVHGLVRGFFASPDRKYKADSAAIREQLRSALEAAVTAEAKAKTGEDLLAAERTSGDRKLDRYKALVRVWSAGVGWAVAQGLVLWAVHIYGHGDNYLQKLCDSWAIVVAPLPVSLALLRVISGKRLWPYVKELLPHHE